MSSKHILLIEDESAIADNIVYSLRAEGFEITWQTLGSAGMATLKNSQIDLVILDVGLPDGSGFEFCKSIRRFSEVPIIFLTARAGEVDRVVGLEIGADDYVVKPFSPRELVARVKAILKRTHKNSEASDTSESLFELDETRARIRYQGKALDLTRYEYLLLKTLLAQPERVFTRSQLMDSVWSAPEASLERSIDAHIKALRAKLKCIDADRDPIRTHRGLGYSLSLAPS